jgi:hypothetical protein
MKTRINITAGNWHAEILAALELAFDSNKIGYTVTLEQTGYESVRVYGLGRNLGSDSSISLLVEESRTVISLLSDGVLYLNTPN